MATKKIKLTRTELKGQRDALARFKRYLPTLKLKQQQIQTSIVAIHNDLAKAGAALEVAAQKIRAYERLFREVGGLNLEALGTPETVHVSTRSIAGIKVPAFERVDWISVDYSLFGTAAWVDRALDDLRERNRLQAEHEILERSVALLQAELKKVMQRVNLFEKIKIPETEDNIRRIRIAVGDQMTAAVARAKIAKGKLEQKEQQRLREGVAV